MIERSRSICVPHPECRSTLEIVFHESTAHVNATQVQTHTVPSSPSRGISALVQPVRTMSCKRRRLSYELGRLAAQDVRSAPGDARRATIETLLDGGLPYSRYGSSYCSAGSNLNRSFCFIVHSAVTRSASTRSSSRSRGAGLRAAGMVCRNSKSRTSSDRLLRLLQILTYFSGTFIKTI